MSNTLTQKAYETRLRRRAIKVGLYLKKSRVKKIHADNMGGWRIMDDILYCVVCGDRWQLSLADVEAFVSEEEARQRNA